MNPFGLVYQDAITENKENEVNIQKITYILNNIKVSANLYTPPQFNKENKYPAITVAHPNGGCKEQVAGLFAQKLAQEWYVTIACDARYQGESEGTPRYRDYPSNRIDDISGRIDYLTQQEYIDNNRIGSLGICDGGGYTLATAQIDKRIKAVATLSMFNTGRVRKNGFMDNDKENIQTRLEKAATARTLEQKGTIQYEGDNPEMTEEQTRQLMETLPEGLYKDGVEYYGITHKHPNSNSKYTTASLQKLMAFDVDNHMDLITQPLLMIAGDKADTKYMTDSAYQKATNTNNKELYLIPGATHIKTYWVPEYVEQTQNKLKEFYKTHI